MSLDDATQPAHGDALPGARILGVAEELDGGRAQGALRALSTAGAAPAALLPPRALAEQGIVPSSLHADSLRRVPRRQCRQAAPPPLPGRCLVVQPHGGLSSAVLLAGRPSRDR